MGFLSNFFGFSKKEDDYEYRPIICDPGISSNETFVRSEESELEKRLAHLTYMLNDYFKHIWGIICRTPEDRRAFVDNQNKRLEDTITEYHQVRQQLGLPFQPLRVIPNEAAFNNTPYALAVQVTGRFKLQVQQ